MITELTLFREKRLTTQIIAILNTYYVNQNTYEMEEVMGEDMVNDLKANLIKIIFDTISIKTGHHEFWDIYLEDMIKLNQQFV